jgi:hypothetical protein
VCSVCVVLLWHEYLGFMLVYFNHYIVLVFYSFLVVLCWTVIVYWEELVILYKAVSQFTFCLYFSLMSTTEQFLLHLLMLWWVQFLLRCFLHLLLISFLLLILFLLYSWLISLILFAIICLQCYCSVISSLFITVSASDANVSNLQLPQEVNILFFIPVQVLPIDDSFKCCQTGKETEHDNL